MAAWCSLTRIEGLVSRMISTAAWAVATAASAAAVVAIATAMARLCSASAVSATEFVGNVVVTELLAELAVESSASLCCIVVS